MTAKTIKALEERLEAELRTLSKEFVHHKHYGELVKTVDTLNKETMEVVNTRYTPVTKLATRVTELELQVEALQQQLSIYQVNSEPELFPWYKLRDRINKLISSSGHSVSIYPYRGQTFIGTTKNGDPVYQVVDTGFVVPDMFILCLAGQYMGKLRSTEDLETWIAKRNSLAPTDKRTDKSGVEPVT